MAGFCGLDFGTSNSCIGVGSENGAALAPVEDRHSTLPSAVFFPFEGGPPQLGRQAIADYIEGEPGRLMRAIKSILASDLIDETTPIGRRRISYRDVVGLLLAHLKRSAEARAGREIDQVVLGRPVEFVGGTDAAAQGRAVDALIAIARKQGFRAIETQFEPIAAALQYEAGIAAEELALIVDIGGGTSDFAIVRVSPERARASDRDRDILAASGARIGGTNFDQRLNLHKLMPFFGFRAQVRREFGEELLEAPPGLYIELSTWHMIMFAYTRSNLDLAKSLRRLALDPTPFQRLEALLEQRLAHQIAESAETAKIGLSAATAVEADLGSVEAGLRCPVERAEFEALCTAQAEDVLAALDRGLGLAGVGPEAINTVFLTGGSSNMPLVQRLVRSRLPQAALKVGDMFGSVGLGLALDARRKFA